MNRVGAGQSLRARLGQKQNSLSYLITLSLKVTGTLLFFVSAIWMVKEEAFSVFLSDLQSILTLPSRGSDLPIETALSGPWLEFREFMILKGLPGCLLASAVLVFLGLKKAQSTLDDRVFDNDYREITSDELRDDFDSWWSRNRKKFEKVSPREDFFAKNDLGAMDGEELLQRKYGAYFTFSEDKILYPESLQTSHTGASGATRTGKTTFIINQLTQARFYGHNSLILDYNGELYKKFGRQEDTILCPFDKRTANYSLFNEPVLPDKIAAGLVAHDINNPFFSNNGRKLLASLMRLSSSHESLYKLIMMDQEPLRDLLIRKGVDTGKLFENNETAGDVITTMQTNLGLLPYLNHWNPKGRPFSLARWAKYGLRGDVFIIVPDSYIEALRSWMRLFFEIAITGALERNPDQDNKPLYIIGDEIKQLGHLQSLEKAVTNGAKYSLRLILGWQTDSQLEGIYGKETSSILGNIRTRAIFNPGNINRGVDDALRLLGHADVRELYVSETHTKDGSNLSTTTQERRKPIVSENRLKGLAELEYFLKLPHQRPVKAIALPHQTASSNKATKINVPRELLLSGLRDVL